MKDYKLEQRAFRDLVRPKVYPKGTKVPFTNRENIETEYPNAAPVHTRNTYKDRSYTRQSGVKAKHVVMPSIKPGPITGSNHWRMLVRKANRLT